MKMLHIAGGFAPEGRMLNQLMLDELERLGELTIVTRGDRMSMDERAALIRGCDVLLTGWGAAMTPDIIANDRGSLKYICNITGTVRHCIGPAVVAAGIPVTNWGDTIAPGVAEGAVALLFAVMKNIRPLCRLVEAGLWGTNRLPMTSLNKLRVGIYGLGVIGRQFVEYIEPFKPIIKGYDPYVGDAAWPRGVERAGSLDALFTGIDALVLHAGLSDETRGTVTAELLAKLPDNGIVINTARGGIIDQAALMAELAKGRLRAGLDVLDSPEAGDMLLLNDPARNYPNLVLSCHNIYGSEWPRRIELTNWQEAALDNLRRFKNGEPLIYLMDSLRYERST